MGTECRQQMVLIINWGVYKTEIGFLYLVITRKEYSAEVRIVGFNVYKFVNILDKMQALLQITIYETALFVFSFNLRIS
jgi:hypothetical protein